MVKYDQIPEFVPGGNPTEYKEWIAFILDQMRAIKGEEQFTSDVSNTLSDIESHKINNVTKAISLIAFVARPDGLYETPVIEHDLNTKNLIAEVYSESSMQPMAFALLPITDNSIKVVLYEPENIIINLDA